jgi:hypothetical protein
LGLVRKSDTIFLDDNPATALYKTLKTPLAAKKGLGLDKPAFKRTEAP